MSDKLPASAVRNCVKFKHKMINTDLGLGSFLQNSSVCLVTLLLERTNLGRDCFSLQMGSRAMIKQPKHLIALLNC